MGPAGAGQSSDPSCTFRCRASSGRTRRRGAATNLEPERTGDRRTSCFNTLSIFFIIAIIAAVFGFGGIAAGAASIAKILFFIFLVVFLVTLLLGVVRRG